MLEVSTSTIYIPLYWVKEIVCVSTEWLLDLEIFWMAKEWQINNVIENVQNHFLSSADLSYDFKS